MSVKQFVYWAKESGFKAFITLLVTGSCIGIYHFGMRTVSVVEQTLAKVNQIDSLQRCAENDKKEHLALYKLDSIQKEVNNAFGSRMAEMEGIVQENQNQIGEIRKRLVSKDM